MAIQKNFAQMSSKKLREILPSLSSEEEILFVENLLAERRKGLTPTKSIQDYKDQFEALYSDMVADMGTDKASVAVTWTVEYKNGVRSIKPITTITF